MCEPQIGGVQLGRLEEPTEAERAEAEELFLAGGGSSALTRVKAVRNTALDGCFEMCRLRFMSMGVPADTLVVFHGTTRQASGSIIRSGFDASMVGSAHGQAFGAGIYASPQVATARRYAPNDTLGEQHMFICRALPGVAKKHHGGGGDILVFRREQQIVPKYLVAFRA